MTDLAKLVVKLEAQTSQYMGQLDLANKRLSKFQRDQETLVGSVNKTFSSFGSSLKGALLGLGAVLSFKGIIHSTVEAEKQFALLKNAVEQTGGAGGKTAEQLAEAASSLQKMSTFDDEAINGMQQLLLRFKSIQGLQFDNARQAVLDLATVLNTDLNSAATTVGKALEDPIKGAARLAKQGITLSDSQKQLIAHFVKVGEKAKAQQLIIDALEGKYGGAALAARNTLGGALASLKNSFGDLLEAKGGVPELTEQLNSLSDSLSDPSTIQNAEKLLSVLLKIASLGGEAVASIGSFGDAIGRTIASATGNLTDIDRLKGEVRDLDNAINNSFMGRPIKYLGKTTAELEALRKKAVETIAAFEGAGANGVARATQIGEMFEIFNRASDPMSRLKGEVTDLNRALNGNLFDRAPKYLLKTREELEALRLSALNAIKTLQGATINGPSTRTPVTGSGGSLPQSQPDLPSEEYEKASSSLKERIALLDKVGEAAKVSYEIQSGALDDLSTKEQQQLLDLAKQYDRVSAARDVNKKSIEASAASAKLFIESHTKAISTLNEMSDSLRQQADMLGMTEEQALRYRMTQGDLAETIMLAGNAGRAYADDILLQTSRLAEFERQQKLTTQAVDEYNKNVSDAKAITEEFQTPLEKLQATIKHLSDVRATSGGALSEETYNRAADAAEKAFAKMSGSENKFFEEAARNTQDILGDGIYDAMTNGFDGGVKGILKSFKQMIDRMVAQALAAKIATSLFGGDDVGGSGGWVGAGIKALGAFGGSRDSGGRGMPGKEYLIGTGAQPERFVPDRPGTFIPAGAGIAGGGALTQNIYVTGQVSQRTARQMAIQSAQSQRVATSRLS